jgi:hypothetical protein
MWLIALSRTGTSASSPPLHRHALLRDAGVAGVKCPPLRFAELSLADLSGAMTSDGVVPASAIRLRKAGQSNVHDPVSSGERAPRVR